MIPLQAVQLKSVVFFCSQNLTKLSDDSRIPQVELNRDGDVIQAKSRKTGEEIEIPISNVSAWKVKTEDAGPVKTAMETRVVPPAPREAFVDTRLEQSSQISKDFPKKVGRPKKVA